jgi:hypothetical protein
MMRVRALATAGLVTALLAQAAAAQNPQPLKPGPVQYTTVTRTVDGGPPFPVRAVFKTNEEYQKFFRTRANAPANFDQEILVLIHLGTQGSEGYSVRVTGLERTVTQPPTLTVKYRISKGGVNANNPNVIHTRPQPEGATGNESDGVRAPCELIKIKKNLPTERYPIGIDLAREQLRFFEEGGVERVGFNVISKAVAGQGAFEQVTVDFTGDVKVRLGGGEPKETRVLLAELDRLATCVQNAQMKSLPRTIPTQQFGGKKFFYNFFDTARKRSTVEGTLNYEGTYADRLRPLAQAFDLILGRLERRSVRVEGTVEAVEEADAVRIQGMLGLSFYLRGPLARKLSVLAGKKVIVEAVAQLTSATTAEGVIGRVLYPQRSQYAGTIVDRGGLAIVGAPPLPEIPLKLMGRAQELVGPEVGKIVLLDTWLFFDNTGIPNEAWVESIAAVTLDHVVLRDRPDAVSLPTGELPPTTTVWVSQRRGGADGLALATAQKSGWTPSQLLRFTYQPRIPGLSGTVLEPPESERSRLEREARERLERGRNPNLPRPPR